MAINPNYQADFSLLDFDRYIYAKMANDTIIQNAVGKHPITEKWQIYNGKAPGGATFPHITFKFAGGQYKNAQRGIRIFTKANYYIVALTDSQYGYGDLNFIAAAGEIDFLFQKDQVTSSDLPIAGCRAIMPIRAEEMVNDVTIYRQGNQIEFLAYPNSILEQ